jgi:Xaa-Pro aminopeptidase
MTPPDLRYPISDAELARRWAAVRTAMATEGLDALVMQNASDWLGGYVRWFTGLPATNGYPRTVIFYADRPMSVVEMGEFGGLRDLGGADALHRGVGRMATTPSFFSVGYSTGYDAALVVDELARAGVTLLGLLTPGALPSALTAALAGYAPVDATDLVDRIKAVKSAEEIGLIKASAALQDQVLAAVCGFIRPGMTDNEVVNFAQAEAHRLGSDQGIFIGSSAPLGVAARFKPRHLQGRAIAKGEHFSLLIEVNGPGGMYTEIARTLVLGRASSELRDHFAAVKAAQDHTLSLIRPGALPADIARAHDDWMRAHGLPPEIRLYAHGQGYDMVERPLIRRDETLPLAEGMCLAVHPGYDDGTVFAVICDNYMVGATGPGPCLHRTLKQIIEID